MTSVNVSTTKSNTTVTETQTGIVVATDGLFGPRSVESPLTLDANKNLSLDMGPFRDSKRVYVSADLKASDTNNGTSPIEPVATIKRAAEIATPGMLIEVGPGVYSEQLPIRVRRDVGILAQGLRNVRIQPASGYEFNNIFQVDSGFWVWGLEFAGHQADLANGLQSWAISFDHLADNTAAPLNASGLGAYILKSPYIQNCSSITAEDDPGTAGSVSVGDTGGGIEVDGDKCAPNSPIRSMVVDSYTQVNLGGPGCHVLNDGYAQLVSFFGTFCTFHVKTETGGQANLSGGGTTDFGDQGLVADGFSRVPNFKGSARVQAFGADRIEKNITFDIAGDLCNSVTNHGLSVNDQVTFNATDGTLPQGVDTGAIFNVIASGLTATAFKVATTQGGTAVNITGSAAGTYQVVRQGSLVCDVVSLTANRVGSQSRPNPGQLMFPRVNFPSAGESGSSGNAVSVSAVNGATATTAIASNGIAHTYAEGGTATVGGTVYSIATAVYDNATGSLEFTATGYTPQVGDSVTFADLAFFCPSTGRYVITGSVPIDASGNTVEADATNLAGYRLNFYNEINGGLRNTLEANQVVDFRLRSQISCALHTMEYVGSGTNYDALPWNGGVPNPAKERVELNGGRVFGATINELGDFEVADGVFEIDGTTGSATINTNEFNISGLNFIGPFSRNGGFSTVGVQLREVSANTSLISSTGAPDGNTVPTQDAVKNYVDTTTVQSVDLSAPTGFTSSGGPVTGSGTLDLAFDTGFQGFLTTESTKLAGIENNATQDQSAAEIRVAYLSNSNTNNFSDTDQAKLSGIEAGAQVNVATNLSYTSATRVVSSSTGADATLPLAVASGAAGLLTGADKTQLDNLSTNLAGKANLSGGKLAASELPDLAITEFKGAVANQTAMLAITGERGDWVTRSDDGKVYVITGTDPTQASDWTALSYPGSDVQSVNGLTGAVVLNADNISDAGTTKKFTTAPEITKLLGIAAGAEVNVQANWNETDSGSDSFIQNKPTMPAGYTDSDVDTHLNTSTASNGEVLSWTGTDYDWVVQSGGAGNTDLSYTASTRVIASSTGTDATLPLMSTGDAGLVPASGGGTTNFLRADGTFAAPAPGGAVDSVNTQTGAVVLDADDISDSSTTNKFTTAAEQSKLAGIQAGAQVNVDTDLSYTDSTRVLTSSTGTNTTLPLMSSANAGLVPASGGGTTDFLRADGTFTAFAASNPVALKLPIATSVTLPNNETEAQISNLFGGTAVFNSANGSAWSFNASSITVPEDGVYCVSIDVKVSSGGQRATNYFMFAIGGTAQQGRSSHSYVRNSASINHAGCVLTELLSLSAGDVLTVRGRAEGTVSSTRTTDPTEPGSISIHKVSNPQGPPGATGATGPQGPSDIPQNSQPAANYTLVASDNGKHISKAGSQITVPPSVFSAGNVVTIYNNSSTTVAPINSGSGVTLRFAGTSSTSNRNLASYGICTILCVASNEFVISGAGLA